MNNLIVHHAISHKILKQPEQADCEVILCHNKTEITEDLVSAVHLLDKGVESSNSVLQGELSSPGESKFCNAFEVFRFEGRSSVSFIDFTKSAALSLCATLKGVIGAKGGDLFFVDYTMEEERMLGVFLLRQANGFIFDYPEEEDFSRLYDTRYTDFKKAFFSMRILSSYGRNVQICFASKRRDGTGQYMVDWSGVSNTEYSNHLTEAFLETLAQLPIPKDEASGFAMNEADFEKAVVKFAAKAPQGVIRPGEFERKFYGGEPVFSEVLEAEPEALIELSKGFKADKTMIKKTMTVKATFGGMTVNCTKEHFRQGFIEINEETGLIEIKNQELASLLLDSKEAE